MSTSRMREGRIAPSVRMARISGFSFAAAGVPLVTLRAKGWTGEGTIPPEVVAGVGSSLLLLGAVTLLRVPLLGKVSITSSVVATLAMLFPVWVEDPSLTLLVLIATTLALHELWSREAVLPRADPAQAVDAARPGYPGAVAAAVVVWTGWVLARTPTSWPHLLPVLWAGGSALTLCIPPVKELFKRRRRQAITLMGGLLVIATALFLLRTRTFLFATLPVFGSCWAAWLLRSRRFRNIEPDSPWEPLIESPERLFVGTFAALCALGSLLLYLPISAAEDRVISGLDAVFTATSAVCVTGLITLDTPRDFSGFGQAVILLLIQLGGLGIMTFSTAILGAMGGKMSLRYEGVVANLMSTRDRGKLFATARRILLFTAFSEVTGTILLTGCFVHQGDSWLMAGWRGLFTSISAFCNAGFALQTNSLISYQNSPLVLHIVAILIVLGGLSPLATFALVPLMRRSAAPVSAQAQIVLWTSGALLLSGLTFFLAFEWNDCLADLSPLDKLHNAWFQSVTLRTAGFNSVDLARLQPATFTLILLFMFIGGSPGGTAGGVKTTTAAIFFLSVLQNIRGRPHLEVFGRRIPEKTRSRAFVIVAVASFSGILALLAVQLTQTMPNRVSVFEVVSALGTVGLSLGGTARLDSVGKVIVILCMFVGRVGGLSLLMFLGSRSFVSPIIRPIEEVDVG